LDELPPLEPVELPLELPPAERWLSAEPPPEVDLPDDEDDGLAELPPAALPPPLRSQAAVASDSEMTATAAIRVFMFILLLL
jgi:hypothetical protein